MFSTELPNMPYIAVFESAFDRTTWHSPKFKTLAGATAATMPRYAAVAARTSPAAPSTSSNCPMNSNEHALAITPIASIAQNANALMECAAAPS